MMGHAAVPPGADLFVDADVDVYDPAEAEWAVATRFRADRDLWGYREPPTSELAPSADHGAGVGLDATVPPGAPESRFTRTRVPGEEKLEIGEPTRPAPGDWQHPHDDR